MCGWILGRFCARSGKEVFMNIFRFTLAVLFVFFSATAMAACNVSATAVNFGSYDVFLTVPTDSTGAITVTCDEAPPPNVAAAIGQSPNSGSFNPRKLRSGSGTDLLSYNLYIDSARVSIWGDGTAGTSTVVRKVTKNKPEILTIYGRIQESQDVSAGLYSETLTATITW